MANHELETTNTREALAIMNRDVHISTMDKLDAIMETLDWWKARITMYEDPSYLEKKQVLELLDLLKELTKPTKRSITDY